MKNMLTRQFRCWQTVLDLIKSDVEDQVEENPNSRYLIMKKGVSYEKAQEFEKIDEDDEKYPNVNGNLAGRGLCENISV